MRGFYWLLVSGLIVVSCQQREQSVSINKAALVDPFIGSGKGNVFSGVSVPFGLVKLGRTICPHNPLMVIKRENRSLALAIPTPAVREEVLVMEIFWLSPRRELLT